MNNLLFKQKITKKEFNKKTIKTFGYENLYTSNYVEDGQKLTLYYVENGDTSQGTPQDLHVGTWTKGEGWIFGHAKNLMIGDK